MVTFDRAKQRERIAIFPGGGGLGDKAKNDSPVSTGRVWMNGTLIYS